MVAPDLKDMSFIKIFLKMHWSIIGNYALEKLCGKHEIFIFQQLNKGIYFCRSMSASQYN